MRIMTGTLDPKKAPPPGVVISSYDELVKQSRSYNATLKLSVSQDGIKVCACVPRTYCLIFAQVVTPTGNEKRPYVVRKVTLVCS